MNRKRARVDELTRRTFLDVEPVPPFRLDLTVWALRRRPDNLFDRWDGFGGLVYFHLLLKSLAEKGLAQSC